MSRDQHVNSIVCSCFHQFRNIAKIRSVVSLEEMEMVVHAFISPHLNYSNSLFTCLSRAFLNRIQMIQNAAARLLTKTSKRSYITLVLISYVCYRSGSESSLKFLFLHSEPCMVKPINLSNIYCSPVMTLRTLSLLVVLQSKVRSKGDCVFEVVAPNIGILFHWI